MLKFANFSIKFLIVFFILLLIFGFSTLWYFSIGLPDYKKLSKYQPPISSRVYSEDGKLIAEYAIEKRLFVPYDSIPEVIVNSFLSAEEIWVTNSTKGVIPIIELDGKKIGPGVPGEKYLQISRAFISKLSG